MLKHYLILSCCCLFALGNADEKPIQPQIEAHAIEEDHLNIGDQLFSQGHIAEAYSEYNKVLCNQKRAKKDKAKAMIRKCFLDYATNNTDEALNNYKSFFGEKKIRRFMRKAKKYSKLLDGAGDKQVIKELIFEMSSNYLDELLTAILEDENANRA